MSKQIIFDWIDQNEVMLTETALTIWENPEKPFSEHIAADLQAEILEKDGFRIKRDLKNLPTAFVAEYGSGKPILGITGEYDALPKLSQKLSAERDPVVEGAPGHGCGHNLLGTGGMGAVMAIKRAMEAGEIGGTVRYYGCPAEEVLAGKVFMVKEGVFDDLDACFSWHPASMNTVWGCSFLALNSVIFNFKGISAHAAAAPEMGRSALKGVELMNIGAHYLREHMNEKARMHCSITNGGGEPNIVPAEASVWYYIRAPKRDQVDEIFERLTKIAEGAAMMTETEVSIEFLAGCYDVLSNKVLSDVMHENMLQAQPPKYTDDDYLFAEKLAATFPKGQKEKVMKSYFAPEDVIAMTLHDGIVQTDDRKQVMAGSIDVGDISWLVPFAQITASTWPVGTAAHSWQAAASSGSGIGMKAMLFAARTIAGTLYDIFYDTDGEILKESKREFAEVTKDFVYKNPIPDGVEPKTH